MNLLPHHSSTNWDRDRENKWQFVTVARPFVWCFEKWKKGSRKIKKRPGKKKRVENQVPFLLEFFRVLLIKAESQESIMEMQKDIYPKTKDNFFFFLSWCPFSVIFLKKLCRNFHQKSIFYIGKFFCWQFINS